MVILYLTLNYFTCTGDVSHLMGLTGLNALNVCDNDISGRLPSSISRIANLRELGLSINKLTGAIPREIGCLVNLTHLWLNDNKFTGINSFL